MKKKLLSILLCLVMVAGSLPTAAFAAGSVDINETNFPDAKFRSFVKENLDKNNDGILDAGEIAAVKMIEANNMGIKSLEGVGFFTALETLKCWDNELTGLDLSKNTALKDLQCSNSKLQSLDLSQNPNNTVVLRKEPADHAGSQQERKIESVELQRFCKPSHEVDRTGFEPEHGAGVPGLLDQ